MTVLGKDLLNLFKKYKFMGMNKEKENLPQETLAVLFHELRNPLNGMLGNTQIMRARFDSLLRSIDEHRDSQEMECNLSVLQAELKTLRSQLQIIESCEKDQLTLLNHFLDFSKLEKKSVTLESKPFSILQAVFKPLTKNYSSLSQEKNILWSAKLPETDQRLMGDAYRLKQILGNLLSNALKFSTAEQNQPAQITLSLTIQPHTEEKKLQSLHIQVKNTGPGLEEEQIKRLFKPYSQTDSSIARRFGGTGLGLVVCKQLLALMNGDIICSSSTSEKWVQFDIRLTLPEAAKLTKTKSPHKKIRPALNLTILVAEDNGINQKIIHAMLAKYNCIVEIANNGKEAIAFYSKQEYALILMDIQMPEMDGLSATQAIRNLEKAKSRSGQLQIPIIGLSANAFTEQREIALKSGMTDYLTKPIVEKNLYDAIIKYTKPNILSDTKSAESNSRHFPPSPSLFSRRISQDSHSSSNKSVELHTFSSSFSQTSSSSTPSTSRHSSIVATSSTPSASPNSRALTAPSSPEPFSLDIHTEVKTISQPVLWKRRSSLSISQQAPAETKTNCCLIL